MTTTHEKHHGGGRDSFANIVDAHSWSWLLVLPLWLVIAGCSSEVVELPSPEPPRTAVCCGCLCLDPSWSCNASTCLADDGGVVALGPEMGLLEIPADHYATYENSFQGRRGPRVRVGYTFLPADEAPEDKPLMVMFNGGPGSSTAILFGFNTGPITLDQEQTGGVLWADNPHRWTRFANLLYIDMPGTGYGYLVKHGDGKAVGKEDRFEPWHDAAQFLTVVLRFLERHPQLRDGPVVLAGESYGGLRASAMLYLLFHYQELLDGQIYRNTRLHDEIREHLAFVFDTEGEVTPDDIAQQFIGQVLIQSYVGPLGDGPKSSACIDGGDPYQCNAPDGHLDALVSSVVQTLVEPEHMLAIAGVDLTTIEWIQPHHRGEIYGRSFSETAHDESALVAVLGEPVGGPYYLQGIDWAQVPWIDTPAPAGVMLASAYYAETFMTDARLDLVVPTVTYPGYLASLQDWVSHVDHQQSSPAGSSRPGVLQLTLDGGIFEQPRSRTIRFPRYDHAGHAVTQRAPAEIAEDVHAWLTAVLK